MSILRNSGWNVMGLVVPSLMLIPAFGIYSRVLGVELLGLLTLSFTIVGFASSLDLGLSRVLIRQVSMHRRDLGMVKIFMGTTTVFVAAVSVLLTALTMVAAPWLVRFLSVSPENSADAVTAFYWLALTIPPYLLALVGTAYFEGQEKFRSMNILRCASGALNAVTGVAAVLCIPTLTAVLAALCISRWLFCFSVYWLYVREVNRLDAMGHRALWLFSGSVLWSSLAYGSWLTVTNVIGSIMTYSDRFVLSHLAGANIVAFYTVPSEVVARLSIVPAAIARSLFPRLSKQHVDAAVDRRIGYWLTFSSSAIALVPVFIFASEILGIWMGPEYTGTPATVLRILLIGFFFNALATGPSTDLQARGHAKIAAGIHLTQVLPYIGGLVWLTQAYGIVGTALAWSLRMLAECILMEWYSRRMPGSRHF